MKKIFCSLSQNAKKLTDMIYSFCSNVLLINSYAAGANPDILMTEAIEGMWEQAPTKNILHDHALETLRRHGQHPFQSFLELEDLPLKVISGTRWWKFTLEQIYSRQSFSMCCLQNGRISSLADLVLPE